MNKEIDVAELIGSRDMKGHNDTHDEYFHKYDKQGWQQISRKPFHWLVETPQMLIQIGVLLEMARLFPGAKVLDYGCGTGWLARSLGYLGCDVEGADVSETAVRVGRDIILNDPLSSGSKVNLTSIDGVRLPYPDQHFHRIVCFSAFHHVADQEATLREIHRVLKDGGIAVFNEPGPAHSAHQNSQDEMRDHGVIENDIVIEDIDRFTTSLGFHPAQIAYFSASPLVTDIPTFTKMLHANDGKTSSKFIANTLENIRLFSLRKTGVPDSADSIFLAGKIEVESMEPKGKTLCVTVGWENTGESLWLPSTPSRPGSVSLGVRIERDGALDDMNRVSLSDSAIQRGAKGSVMIPIPLEIISREKVHLGLVSEHVSWFCDLALPA